MMKKHTELTPLLLQCQTAGRLTVADIAWYLGRSHKTVREWFKGRQPDAANHAYAFKKVGQLASAIAAGRGFPIPDLNKRARAEYMRLLGEGHLGRARILAADPAKQRLVRRLGPAPHARGQGRVAAAKAKASPKRRTARKLAKLLGSRGV